MRQHIGGALVEIEPWMVRQATALAAWAASVPPPPFDPTTAGQWAERFARMTDAERARLVPQTKRAVAVDYWQGRIERLRRERRYGLVVARLAEQLLPEPPTT